MAAPSFLPENSSLSQQTNDPGEILLCAVFIRDKLSKPVHYEPKCCCSKTDIRRGF